MGVHSLWDIVSPSARTVRLEALSRKKMAVDASIWIYQFLKAVRDKEGHSLHNSHIVGFFRRICKLLYFGIQPVFVFDGGAPALKRKTILRRKERRRDKQETLQRTAQKLLALQLQKKANDEYDKEVSPRKLSTQRKVEEDGENLQDLEFENYFEDYDYLSKAGTNKNTDQTVTVPKKEKVFRKDDDYHLPEVDLSLPDKDDQRMITDWEFQRLTEGLEHELNGVDLENIDPTSEAFQELPLATQYMVLSHLRLRSRLRMGYTKEQLETLFPNRMDFSKFQISMVQKRNFLTQRLMNINGMDNVDIVATRRIAGERGREYQLLKNDDGYTLSLGNEGNTASRPIQLDEIGNPIVIAQDQNDKTALTDDDDEELEFEDVALTDSVAPSQNIVQDKGDDLNIDLLFLETESKMINSYKQSDFYDSAADATNDLEKLLQYHSQSLASDSKIDQNNNEGSKPMEQVHAPSAKLDGLSDPSKGSKNSKIDTTFAKLKVPSFSFQKSMLSGQKTTAETKHELQKPNIIAPILDEQFPESSSSESVPSGKQKLQVPTISEDHHSSSQQGASDVTTENEDEKKKPEKKEKALPAPEWFGKSQVGFGKSNPYITDYSIYNKNNSKTADEEVGLISLEQAREFIEDDDDDDSEDENNSDFEIIEKPEKQSLKPVSSPKQEGDQISDPQGSTLPVLPAIDYDFSESEEDDLIQQLQQEEFEHERFKSSLNNSKAPSWSLDAEKELTEQRKKDRRDADEVTQGMIQDVQELLSRFGIPFITAPMEAEAQCAELFRIGLVDGIITDDSDCFLFGGDMVYKNMFSEKNYVECYIMEDIERDLGLNRARMIELAMLLGSDYTDGLKGVGKVTAMEILADFQEGEDGSPLINFRNWWLEYQRGVKIDPKESTIKKKLRKTFQKKLFLDMGFPDPLVSEAYLRPDVDDDKTEFKWGAPDLDRLRTFLMYNIGWSKEKVDEVLVPVIRDINKKQQTTISEFFPRDSIQTRKELMVGKRLKDATKKLTSNKRQKK